MYSFEALVVTPKLINGVSFALNSDKKTEKKIWNLCQFQIQVWTQIQTWCCQVWFNSYGYIGTGPQYSVSY